MAARVVSIVPKTKYTIANAASTTTTVVLGPRAVLTPDWVSGVLSVRLHSATIPASYTVAVSVFNAYISPDDPNTLFLSSSNIGTVSMTSATPTGSTQGSLLTAALSSIGPMVAVQLIVTPNASAGTVTIEISVDLVGRDN